MATSSAQSKVCRVCGVDCAGKPRHKDSKGRYVCDPCLQQLKSTTRGYGSVQSMMGEAFVAGIEARVALIAVFSMNVA